MSLLQLAEVRQIRSTPKYYKINTTDFSADNSPDSSPQKLTQRIIRNHKFVYIDIHEDSAIKEMELIDAREAQQLGSESIGKSTFISNLGNLSPQSQKAMDYVYKLKEFHNQKQKANYLLKKKLDNSEASKKMKKLKDKKNRHQSILSFPNLKSDQIDPHSPAPQNEMHDKYILPRKSQHKSKRLRGLHRPEDPIRSQNTLYGKDGQPLIYGGTTDKVLNEYRRKKQLQEINQKIIEREKLLISKYGITSQYQSILNSRSSMVPQTDTVFPEIKSMGTLMPRKHQY